LRQIIREAELAQAACVTHVIAEESVDRTCWLGNMRAIARNLE